MGNTDKRSEGTGLGLAMSSKIIEMMAGSIQVNSQLNAGSQFWFDLDRTYAEFSKTLTLSPSPKKLRCTHKSL